MSDIRKSMSRIVKSDRNQIIQLNSYLKDSCQFRLLIKILRIQMFLLRIKIVDQIQLLMIEDLTFTNFLLKICSQLKLLLMNLSMRVENDYQRMNFSVLNAKN